MPAFNGAPVTRSEFRAGLKGLRAAFKKYPTKKDLQGALRKYATKTDLAGLRAELRATERRLVAHLLRNSTDIEGIRRDMANMATKDDINRILTVMDGMSASYQACWNKLVVHDHRIETLEKRVGPESSG